MTNDPETQQLLERARDGDERALSDLFTRYQRRLERLVELRMDRRMQGRVGTSDVIQEAYIEVARKLADYLKDPRLSFFVWLRLVTSQTLTHLHQFHLGTKKRDARIEISIYQDPFPESASETLAAKLLGDFTSPSKAAERGELKARLQEALNSLAPMDREVLALRHFEHLTLVECAQVLGIQPPAASKRYIRAALRLRDALKRMGIDWGALSHDRA